MPISICRNLFFFAALMTTIHLAAFKYSEIELSNRKFFRLESDSLIIDFSPLGGTMARCFYKQGKLELINTAGRRAFTECDWQKDESRDFLYKREFTISHEQKGDTFTVTCRGHHMGGGINFLVVTKKYTIRKGSPVIDVEYDFHNQQEAMSSVQYNFLFHNGFTLHGVGVPVYFIPMTYGIIDQRNTFLQDPARGWIGAVSPQKTGMTMNFSFPEIHNLMVWTFTTMECRFLPIDIANGKSFKTRIQAIPFTGLPVVSGSGNGVAGSITHDAGQTAPGTIVPVEIKLFDGIGKRRISVELFRRESGSTQWNRVTSGSFDFPAAAQLRSLKSAVKVGSRSVELEAVIRSGKKELARLNSRIKAAGDPSPWRIDQLEKKIKSDLRRPDLTGFTHITPEPDAVPWAKPLKGGKIKLLALGPKITQLGDLTHRFDVEFHTTWIGMDRFGRKLSSMSYLLNEFAGKANFKDVVDNLKKSLKKKYDVILLAGISWKLLPADVKSLILDQISAGTGLVITGVDGNYDFLKLEGPFRKQIKASEVEVLQNNFLTAGVPFDFLPLEDIFDLSGGVNVHAEVSGRPYIVSAEYGKGRIVAYNYYTNVLFTGLIPVDKPEPHYIYDKPTPYEFYYAMLGKGLLFAAGRTPELTFRSFKAGFKDDKVTFDWLIDSAKDEKYTVEYFITDRLNELRKKGTFGLSAVRGSNKTVLALQLPPYVGKSLVSVIIRNKKGESVNYGSWSFRHEPGVRITAVSCGSSSYRDGDTIDYEVRFSNIPIGCRMKVELEDSYGRVLERRLGSPASLRSGSFKLNNPLPARYAKIRAYLLDDADNEIDTGGVWFYTRPADHLMKWDDYKVASIIYWNGPDSFFRMKRTAESYRQTIGLDILFNCWGLNQVLLGNFEPRMVALSAIGSQNFPSKEYLKSGNKMMLDRKNCLSSPEVTEPYFKKLAEKARQGYAYGAVVYDNGDEVALSRSGASVDFCFSPSCLANFRQFLRKKYISLEKLNQNWNTGFSSWEEVLPATKEEAWKSGEKLIASWADHREFMDWLCEDHLQKSVEVLRKYDPAARYMNSGSHYPSAYGGIDWARLMPLHGGMQHYGAGDHDEMLRSFAGADYKAFPWYMGYGLMGQKQIYRIWRSAFLEASGISPWCIYSGVLYPDMTLQPGSKTGMPHVWTLKKGVGKLLMKVFRPVKAEVAIYYSQASLRAAFYEKRTHEHGMLWQKYAELCRNLGVEFKYVSYRQIADGELEKGNYKLLIMGDITAMSDLETAAVRKFFDRGGHILAEGTPGTRYANCVRRTAPALADLFSRGSGRAELIEKIDSDYIIRLAGADSKANRPYIDAVQERFAAALDKCGIAIRQFRIKTSDGSLLPEGASFLRKAQDGTWFAGIVTRNETSKKISIALPEKGHVYDVVSGKYFGFTEKITADFSSGRPMGVAVMRTRPQLAKPEVSKNTISLQLRRSQFPAVVNIEVRSPSGKIIREYGHNLLLKKGRGTYTVPFAVSDPAGKWQITCTESISRHSVSAEIIRK